MKRKHNFDTLSCDKRHTTCKVNISINKLFYSKTLTHITIPQGSHNFPLPKKIQVLFYDNCFSSIILHKNLIDASFGYFFNKPVRLTNRLIKISFGDEFNQSVQLPKSLNYVVFGKKFSQKVVLPNKLKYISTGLHFNQYNILPKHLAGVKLSCVTKKILLPESVERLSILDCAVWFIENLPNNLREIHFSWNFAICPDPLPNTIEILEFDCKFFRYSSIIKYPNILKIIVYDKIVYSKRPNIKLWKM